MTQGRELGPAAGAGGAGMEKREVHITDVPGSVGYLLEAGGTRQAGSHTRDPSDGAR